MAIQSTARGPDTRTIVRRGITAIVVAVVANVLVLTAVLQTGAVPRFQPLNYTAVVFLTTTGLLGATVVYWLLVQWKPAPDRLFVWIAGIILLVSFVPDLGLLTVDPQATIPGIAVLMAMHVIAAVVAVGVLTELGR